MTVPETVREQNFQNEGFRSGVEGRVGLLQKMVWTVLGLLGAVLISLGAMYVQTGDIKTSMTTQIGDLKTSVVTQVGEVKTDVAVIKNSLAEIPARLARIETDQRQALGTVIPAQLSLTPDQAQYVRQFLKVLPKTSGPGRFVLNDHVVWDVVKPGLVPDDLAAKVPALKGLRFAVDVNNAVAFIDPTGRVVAII